MFVGLVIWVTLLLLGWYVLKELNEIAALLRRIDQKLPSQAIVEE